MPYSMQCLRWNNPTPYKGGSKRQSYAPSNTRTNPAFINVYIPDANGDLVLTKRIRPKAK